MHVIFRLITAFGLFGGLLFLPAGTFDWTEAWTFILILLIYGILLQLLVFRKYPTIAKSRQRYKPKFGIDTLILFFAGISLFAVFIVAGLDVGRFQWSSPYVAPIFKYLGFSLLTCALVVYMLVMKENAYLSRVIEVQQGQQLITTGPYAMVRHPMYLGNVLFICSLPFALGSFLALIPGILFLVLFIPRIYFEEKVLSKEFPEYNDYMIKVRYRVIPKLW